MGATSLWPWYLLGLGQAAFFAGDVAWHLQGGAGSTFPAAADVLYVAAYPLMAAGIACLIRQRSPTEVGPLLDASLMAVAGGLVLWLIHVDGFFHDTSIDMVPRLVLLAYPLGDVILLAGAAYLLLGHRGRGNASVQVLVASVALLLGADVLYQRLMTGAGASMAFADGLWMAAYILVGAAALLPSMAKIGERAEPIHRAGTRALLQTVVSMAMIPGFVVAQQLINGHVDTMVVVVTSIIVVGLLLLRIQRMLSLELSRERRYAALLERASDAFAVIGGDGRLKFASPASENVLGFGPDVFVGRDLSDVLELIHPADLATNRPILARVLARPGTSATAEIRARHRDGSWRWLSVTATNRGEDQAVGGVVLNFHDITQQHRTTAELTRLETAIEQTSESVVITDLDGTIEYVNSAFERITGYAAAEVVGRNPRLLKSGEQPSSFYGAMWTTLTAGQSWVAEFINRRKDGSEYISSAVISPIRDEAAMTTGYVGVARDVTRERHTEEAAQRLARERALIAETIREMDGRGTPEEIAQGICRQVASLADVQLAGLYVFEIDGEAVPYGSVLTNGEPVPTTRIPAKRTRYLLEQAQRGPWIERWRSVPGHPYNDLFKRLRIKATAYAPVRDGDDVIGLLIINSALPDAEQGLAGALPALVEFADISGTLIGAKLADRTRTASARRRLRQIVDEHMFQILFQPIVDTEMNCVVGYEALTRFSDGVAPDVRFAEAAALGMSVELETSVIREILAQAGDLPEDVWLNINVSPAVLRAGSDLADLLGRSNRKLIVEITEHEAIDDYETIREAVHRLGPNVRLAIDDAGAGFASMRHIVELRPAFVKLDRAVVAGIDSDEARRGLVAGMRHFARTAGFWLIAEGIETEAELKTLSRLDIHFVQGFLLGRPAPTHWIGMTDSEQEAVRP